MNAVIISSQINQLAYMLVSLTTEVCILSAHSCSLHFEVKMIFNKKEKKSKPSVVTSS